jgi:hypothetical protein
MLTLPQGCAMSVLRRERLGRESRLEKVQSLASSRKSRKEPSEHARPTSAQLWRLSRQRRIQLMRLAGRRCETRDQAGRPFWNRDLAVVRQKLDLGGRLPVRWVCVRCFVMIIFHFLLYLTLHSLLHTYPQATTYSTHSRSGFSCSPTRQLFSLEPLNLFSEPGLYILFSFLSSRICGTLFFQPVCFSFQPIFFSPPSSSYTCVYAPVVLSLSPASKACLCLFALTIKPALPSIRPDATLPAHIQPFSVNRSPSARLRRPRAGACSITTHPSCKTDLYRSPQKP